MDIVHQYTLSMYYVFLYRYENEIKSTLTINKIVLFKTFSHSNNRYAHKTGYGYTQKPFVLRDWLFHSFN